MPLNPRVKENLEFRMPRQLSESLYRALVAGDSNLIAEVGLAALALENITQFDDKSAEYAEVWQEADTMLDGINYF